MNPVVELVETTYNYQRCLICLFSKKIIFEEKKLPKNPLNIHIKDIPQNVGEITDGVALSYFKKQSSKQKVYTNLSLDERNFFLKKVRRQTMLIAGIYGALGVFFLYLPRYIYPEIENLWGQHIQIFFGQIKDFRLELDVRFSLFDLLYGMVLVSIEIWLLTMLDLKAVSRVAALYGFPSDELKKVIDEEREFVYIGLGKEHKKLEEIGINPFQRISKAGVVFLLLVFRLKALISNFLFRMFMKRVLGRLAIRAVIELVAIPVYAFWNAYASAVVIRKINMRMLVDKMMRTTGQIFYNEFKDNSEFKLLIYDTLEYLAIAKKSYHPTDYIYAKHLLQLFQITPEPEHEISENYFETLKNASPDVKTGIGRILLIGFVIDGKIGSLEKRIIRKMQKENIMPYDVETLKRWTKRYAGGYGFDEMFDEKSLI